MNQCDKNHNKSALISVKKIIDADHRRKTLIKIITNLRYLRLKINNLYQEKIISFVPIIIYCTDFDLQQSRNLKLETRNLSTNQSQFFQLLMQPFIEKQSQYVIGFKII